MDARWTPDEAIAYECARECLVELMAICTGELHHGAPAKTRRAELLAERTRLAAELRHLHLDDRAGIERIRRDYGARIRAWREGAGPH